MDYGLVPKGAAVLIIFSCSRAFFVSAVSVSNGKSKVPLELFYL